MTPSTPKTNKKKLLIIPICILLILGITIAFIYIYQEKISEEAKQQSLDRLSAECYESIFFSMYPINNDSADDFMTYKEISTEISGYNVHNLTEVSEFLDAALLSGNNLSIVYLGVDPYKIWTSSRKDPDIWNSDLEQNLLSYVSAYPEITFEILLPYPNLEYWTSKKTDTTNEILTTYRSFICSLEPYSNAYTYFAGAEHWLIANPGNYESTFNTNRNISQKITLSAFCDHNMRIASVDVDIVFDQFKAMLQEEKDSPADYPDLSDWQIVFFGDSVIGNYTGSASVPGVINGLSGASVYNFAVGGSSATVHNDSTLSFPQITGQFLSGELTVTQDNTNYNIGSNTKNNDKLCFVIHYGLNDYFDGQAISNSNDIYDPHTYTGALRTGIRQLQDAYPEATILLLSPPFCAYFSNGTDVNSSVGGTLSQYAEAVIQVANEMNVNYLDNHTALGINAKNHTEYLADGCHLNETGRFLAATHIIEHLKTNRNIH